MKTGIGVVGILIALAALGSSAAAQQDVTGKGTAGLIPVWTGPHKIADSVISQGSNGTVSVDGTSFISLYGLTSNSSDGSTAVFGDQTGTTGVTFGVQGYSASPNGVGVQGTNTASAGSGGSGVAGFFNGTSGSGNGVFGQTSSTEGSGGYFQTTAASGAALTAIATTTTGNVAGLTAQTSCPSCTVVFAQNLATTGEGPAVIGQNSSTEGVGVEGINIATSGFPQGFYGEIDSATGTVALFRSVVAGGNIIIGQAGPGTSAVNVFRVDSTGKGFFDGGTQTSGADFAESVAITTGENRYAPGDLLALDARANRQLTLAAGPYSTLVAGIYSTKPGVLATTHKIDAAAPLGEVPLAIVGIVPCKVSAENGPIQRGDLLVTSSTPGHAMKGTDRGRMLGAVVGKAMEPLENGTGIIQVLVTLQ